VDVIFKSKGEIYLDTEMYQRSITAEYHGKRLRLVAPEDLIIIKASPTARPHPVIGMMPWLYLRMPPSIGTIWSNAPDVLPGGS